MGQSKKDWIEVSQRGYTLLDSDHVCNNCINDLYLKSLHEENAEIGECSFCDEKNTLVADASIIQEQIMNSLMSDYEDIENAGAPYESREGGWQVSHSLAFEVVEEETSEVIGEKFQQAIVNAVNTDIAWCERDWQILSPFARLRHGWTQFCDIVKHRLRFSYEHTETMDEPSHPDYTHPSLTIQEIGNFVDELQLIKELPIGKKIYRVRIDSSEFYSDISDLGSPPPEKATSNRMSPAGIPMFYGAADEKTAIDEIWDGINPAFASIATFEVKCPIRIIDFTMVPPAPSYWSNPGRDVLGKYWFLNEFTSDISRPIQRGIMADVYYAPTQIICEYLTKAKYGFPRSRNPSPTLIHGIVFASSKTGENNFGLNLLRDTDGSYGIKQSDFLGLIHVEHRELDNLQA